ncbi:MAG: hypothetical protein MAG431_00846 [Chloroflexi bacterium]|nr:hypothetical protein [Chloroflexota bacterium]
MKKKTFTFLLGVLAFSVFACNMPSPTPTFTPRAEGPLLSQTLTFTSPTQEPISTLTPTLTLTSTPPPPSPTSTLSPTPTQSPVPTLGPLSPVEGYLILTNTAPGDPYYEAALMLSRYRDAEIITFNDSPEEALDKLRAREVSYVAFVLPPTTMDEDLAYEVFQVAKNLDAEYDTDFAYGFITGITPEDAKQYVRNVAAYEAGLAGEASQSQVVWRTGEGAISGGAGSVADEYTQTAVDLLNEMDLGAARIDSEELTLEELLVEISPSDVLLFNLHASPIYFETQRGDGLLGTDLLELERGLFVFHTGCYAGAVHKWYNQNMASPATYDERAQYAEPADSLTLNFMRNGTLAYFGRLCMWGGGNWPVFLLESLENNHELTVGEMMAAWYNLQSAPRIIEESAATDIIGMDRNRFSYAAIVLYGDPALRIISP